MWQANAPQNEVGATAEVATLKFFGDGLAGVSPAGQEQGREGSEVTECVWYSGSVNFTFKFKNFSTAFVAGTLSLQLQLPQSMADRGGEADRKRERETESERAGHVCEVQESFIRSLNAHSGSTPHAALGATTSVA